jgi:hypothetical protein
MPNKEERSSDGFAPFQRDDGVQDNNAKLMVEKERQENRHNIEMHSRNGEPKEDIYAQFRLSDAVQDMIQRKQEKDEAGGKAENSKDNDKISRDNQTFWKRRLGMMPFGIKFPRQRQGRKRSKESFEKQSSGGKEEKEEEECEETLPVLAQVSTGSDKPEWESTRIVRESTTEASPSRANDHLVSHFYWESPADDIFSDFDLKAIVRDYEKLQRKVKYPPKRVLPDSAYHENDSFAAQLKTMRYKNVKEWWLDHFPRCHGIIFRVLIPQCIVMLIAMGLGYILAKFEIDDEYRRNDAVSAKMFRLQQLPRDEGMQFLLRLPKVCFNIYLSLKTQPFDNFTIADDATLQYVLAEWFGGDLPSLSPDFGDDIQDSIEEIERFMELCGTVPSNLTTRLAEYNGVNSGDSDLTFNWIRW